MLDYADLHRAQQEREARRRRTVCATCASSGGATIRRRRAAAGRRAAGVPDHRQPLQRSRASTACSPRSCARSRRQRHRRRDLAGLGSRADGADAARPADSRARARAIWPRSPRAVAGARETHRSARSSAARRAFGLYRIAEGAARCARCRRRSSVTARRRSPTPPPMRRGGELRAAYNRRWTKIGAEATRRAQGLAGAGARGDRGDLFLQGPRPRSDGRELHREPVAPAGSRSSPCRASPTGASMLHFIRTENLPGAFPYTGGVYPYRREEEDPTRMFAGEGAPERTNRRFHYLARGGNGRRDSPPLSIRPRCTARIRTRGRTSTDARAIPASRSRRSMT